MRKYGGCMLRILGSVLQIDISHTDKWRPCFKSISHECWVLRKSWFFCPKLFHEFMSRCVSCHQLPVSYSKFINFAIYHLFLINPIELINCHDKFMSINTINTSYGLHGFVFVCESLTNAANSIEKWTMGVFIPSY